MRKLKAAEKIKREIRNAAGCVIARWIIGKCDGGLVVKRREGAEQIIKVFSTQAYKNVIYPAIHRAENGPIRVGDVVTDNGYYGEIAVTMVGNAKISGYALSDGQVYKYLPAEKFAKVIGHVDTKVKHAEN